MADEKTTIEINTELNSKDNSSKIFDKNTESINKNTEALERNAKARAKTGPVNSTKTSQESEKIDQKTLEDKKKTQSSVNKIMSREEAISNMTEEQLKVYQYIAKTERKRINQSERRLKNTEKNIALEEQAEERKRKNQERLNKQTEAYTNYMEARTAKVNTQRENYTRKRTSRYQAGRGFISAGSYLGKNLPSPVGNIASTGMQMLGAGLSNPASAASFAITQLTKAITQFAKSATQSYAEIESIRTNLGVVYGNQTQANDAFNELSAYAIKSPFGVQQISELATLLKQSGVEATNLMDTLKMLGDTAGGNMEKMKRIANNYAQIVSIGKASMLDMRQFAYAGIPIFEKVAEELKVSQSQLRKMISDGKVTSEVIEDVFKKMTSAGGLFYEATSQGAETLKARLTNLKDIKQLALGGMGEGLLRIGEKTGGDSIAYKGLSLAEDFYTKINNISTLQNLEKSVKTINNNLNSQKDLEDLIKYAKDTKVDPDIIKVFENKLKELKSFSDPDKQRSIYASLYEEYGGLEKSKYINIEKAIEALEIKDDKITLLTEQYNNDLSNLSKRYEAGLNNPNTIGYGSYAISKDGYEVLLKNINKEYNNSLSILEAQRKVNEDNYNLLKKQQKITDEMTSWWNEKKVISAQQAEIDTVSSYGKRSSSVLNDAALMRQQIESSDSYKKSEQEKLIQRLQESRDMLKEISKSTKIVADGSEDGIKIIDFAKVSGDKLQTYITKGAVTGRKLATNKYESTASTDWKLLREQVGNRASAIIGKFGAGRFKDEYATEIQTAIAEIIKGLQPEQLAKFTNIDSFYTYFNNTFAPAIKKLEELSAGVDGTEYQQAADYLNQSLIAFIDDIGDLDEWSADMLDKSKDFIPLWKRLIANATGISSSAISDKTTALNSYRDDLAVRNNAKGYIGTYLGQGGSFNNVLSMLSTTGERKRLREAGYDTYQIDFSEVKKNLKEFSLSLKSSTNVIDSYKSGLESQLNSYIALAQALIEPESQDLKSSKTVTKKKLSEVSQSEGEQLVNAFGDKLQTIDGLPVTVRELEDGTAQFYYKNGDEEIQLTKDQVYIGDALISFLKKEIPAIRAEIAKASIAQAKNKTLSKLLETGELSTLQTLGLNISNGKSGNISSFYLSNPEEFQQLFSANLNLGNYESESELYTDYLKGNSVAVGKVNDALFKTNNIITQLMNSPEFKSLNENADKNARRESLLRDYETVQGWNSDLTSTETPSRELGRSVNLGLFGDTFKLAGLSGENDIKDLIEQFNGLSEAELRASIAGEAISNTFKEMNQNLLQIAKNTASDMFLSPFKTLGENMDKVATGAYDWSMYLEDAKSGLRAIAGQMLGNLGNEMATAGLRIAAAGALEGPAGWGKVAAGLSLAAAGGVASGLGSMLTSAQKNNDKDGSEKLKSLAEDLQKLLDQARSDALYYENNLRHKTALGINKQFSNKSVNDAIIAPNGNIITTAPDDYLIATKTPGALANNQNVTVQPKINFTVIDNSTSGAKVAVEQQQNSDGSIDFIAKVYDAMDNYIATSRSDDAFAARQYRINGRQAIR